MKKVVTLLLLGSMIAMAGLAAGEAFNDGFYNPVRSESMLGDPWMVEHDGMYYYTQSDGATVTITPSKAISGQMFRTAQSHTIFTGALYGLTEIWAPELHFYDGHWYALFAADTDHNNVLHRMYAIKSETDDILGAYGDPVMLELPDGQWAIDGTHFEHEGKLYHIWSGWKDEAEGSTIWRQYLYICEMETPDKVAEGAERVRISAPLKLWESFVLPQNEGPTILKSPEGTVYLVYSGNFSGSDDYCLGLLKLVGEDPLDPKAWEKFPDPIFASDKENRVYAPGHCSFVKSPDGTEDWIIYHMAKRAGAGWDRLACAQKIKWVDDTPVLGTPSTLATLHALPSGESVNRVLYPLVDGRLEDGAQAVENPGASGGKAVALENVRSKVTVTLSVPETGRYAILIRYSNPEDANSIRVTTQDDRRLTLYAGPSGGEDIFSLISLSLELDAGETVLRLQGSSAMQLDAIILDLDRGA